MIMHVRRGSYSLIFLGAIVISAIIHPVADGKINLQLFDPIGRSTSLFYDGGSMDVYCDSNYSTTEYITVNNTKVSKQVKLPTVKINTSQGLEIKTKDKQPINYNLLHMVYICPYGHYHNSITIRYILCNPTIMPPIYCADPAKQCQITVSGSAVCRQLQSNQCQKSSRSTSFPYACMSESLQCEALSKGNESAIHYVATHPSYCKAALKIYSVANDPPTKQHLYMNRWVYIDVRYRYGISVDGGDQFYRNYDYMSVNATVNGAAFGPQKFYTPRGKWSRSAANISGLVESIERLNKPVNAFIALQAFEHSSKDWPRLYWSVQLFVFNSKRDLQVQAQEVVVCRTNGIVVANLTINVTVAKGLYVCTKQGEENCIPTTPTNMVITNVITTYDQRNHSHMASFYVRLFTWSPRKRYALVYSGIVYYRKPVHSSGSTKDGMITGLVVVTSVLLTTAWLWSCNSPECLQ